MNKTEYEFLPADKIKMAQEFQDTPFWRKVFQPYLKERIMEGMSAFINCKKEDLDRLQAAVVIYNDLDDFVDNYVEEAQVQIEMDKAAEKIESARQVQAG